MRIHHIAMAKNDKGLSGGEICMISLIQYFCKKKCQNIILTTPIGKKIYEKAGLREDGVVIIYHIGVMSESILSQHTFIAWTRCAIAGIRAMSRLTLQDDDIAICYSIFYPDFLTAFAGKLKNSRFKIYYWYHMLAPRLFFGYEGEFTNLVQVPRLNVLFYNINQYIFKLFLNKRDVIITINKYYESILKRLFPHNHIYKLEHFGGGNEFQLIRTEKKFDGVWVGRFHPQKGIFHLLNILSRIAFQKPNVKVLIIGDGDNKLKRKFFLETQKYHLTQNVEYVGSIVEPSKYIRFLSESKILLMTSTYEGFGLVNLDAMKQALPVVAYDLPPYESLRAGMVTVPVLNNEVFAKEVLKLLTNKTYYEEQSQRAYEHSKHFSWDAMGKEIFQLMQHAYV